MPNNQSVKAELEIEQLRAQLHEAEETLEAIRTGAVDALVVKGKHSHQIFTLKTADYTYRRLIESMNEGALTIDSDGIILYANHMFSQMVGLQMSSILGSPLRRYFSELGSGKLTTGHHELELRPEKQSVKSVFISVFELPSDDDTELFGIVVTDMTDHTERRRLQILTEKLRQSEEHIRMMADNIPNLAWTADKLGNIFWYNSRWYEYTGTTPEEMMGWGWQTVHDPGTLPAVIKKWTHSIKSGETFEMVFPIRGADGSFRPFLTRVVPIRDDSGEIIRWFGTNTDIAKQKELERQKDDFIGIASHELKTPVTSIKAYTQILERRFKRRGDIESAKYLSRMNVQLISLSNLIGDLLDVTKIEAGQLPLQIQPLNFDLFVTELIETIQLTTDTHKILLDGSTGATITTDKERLRQVFSNLLSNAIKYSPSADKIVVSLRSDSHFVRVGVQDFGIGMGKASREHVFERFYRVNGSNSDNIPGLGLGLYISSEIIKRLGGRIWVEGENHSGSIFYFTVPISAKKEGKAT